MAGNCWQLNDNLEPRSAWASGSDYAILVLDRTPDSTSVIRIKLAATDGMVLCQRFTAEGARRYEVLATRGPEATSIQLWPMPDGAK